MVTNTYLVLAARIAYTFQIDPEIVLDADFKAWTRRLAAYKIVMQDRAKQNQQQG